MPLRTARAIVGVANEATAGTYVEPSGAQSHHAFDINVSYAGEATKRQDTRLIMEKFASVPAPATGEIAFSIYLVGSSAAGQLPYYDLSLKACGLRSSLAAGAYPTYKPWSTFDGASQAGPPALQNPHVGYSVSVWMEGVKHSLRGAYGNLVVKGQMGQPLIGTFSFKGAYEAFADDAIPVPTVSALSPITFLGTAVTLGGYTPTFESMEWDLGNDIIELPDANTAAGINKFWIRDRMPKGKVNPDVVLAATHNFFSIWRAGTLSAINTGAMGSVVGNRIAITAANCQYGVPSMGDRNGGSILDLPFDIMSLPAAVEGDSLTITIT